MSKRLFYLTLIFRPSFWQMNHSYSKAHDAVMIKLLNTHEIQSINHYYCRLGNTKIWIANFPYAAGVYDIFDKNRPSRYTLYLLGLEIEKAKNKKNIQDESVYYRNYYENSF